MKETQREPEKEVEINVFLVNSDKLALNIKSYDQTDDLLEVNILCKWIACYLINIKILLYKRKLLKRSN